MAIVNQMVDQIGATFHALADPTRRAMVARLADGEQSVAALAEPFEMSLWGAAKHIKVLEAAGIVTRHKVGRSQFCTLRPAPLAAANQWLQQWERTWNVRLDLLESLLRKEKQGSSAALSVQQAKTRPRRRRST